MTRRFQFSLRWILGLTVVFALVVGAASLPVLSAWTAAIAIIGALAFLVFCKKL